MRLANRIVDVLYCLQTEVGGLGVTEIAEKTGLPKGTVHGLLRALADRGLVVQDSFTQRYGLGLGLLVMASTLLRGRSLLLGFAQERMERLRDQSGETVCLHIPFGLERVCVLQVESHQAIRYAMEVGKPVPLYCGAAGKVLLASMPEQVVDQVIYVTGLAPLGPNTVTDAVELRRQLEAIRSDGYSITFEERTPSGATAAAPVRDGSGQVVACVALYGPRYRLNESRLKELVPELLAVASEISNGMSRGMPPKLK